MRIIDGSSDVCSSDLLDGLDARAERIRAELDEAQRLREEAQKALAEYKRKQRDAAKEAEDLLANAKHEAELLRRQAAEDLKETLARREKAAIEKIAQAETQALQERTETRRVGKEWVMTCRSRREPYH